jgi:hypothetical protein
MLSAPRIALSVCCVCCCCCCVVLSQAFPCGTRCEPDLRDIDFVVELIGAIEANGIAAPCPIEQRWTARSTSCVEWLCIFRSGSRRSGLCPPSMHGGNSGAGEGGAVLVVVVVVLGSW